ncbi:MAG: quinolinate synthase NadA [Bacteroidales bacterium]|jgi:quinolinate synthase|nr:quinolinate synthase NadA [Bacteroidales bacterium]
MKTEKNSDIINEINRLKKEKNAVLLAHYYQIAEIQDIADFVGDSLNLSQAAQQTDADIILFCGVHFMGETAKILNPKKKVLIPDMQAGCSLADSCKYDDFKQFKDKHNDHLVISYINCSAQIKTLSDIICTSGNALQLVNSLPIDKKIIFAPDKNLGGYLNRITGRNMLLWDGVCEVHQLLNAEHIIQLKIQNKDAVLVAHPECNNSVLELADFIGSTQAMIKFIKQSEERKFLVATESGIIHQLKKDNPDKEFIVVASDESCACNDCRYMKMNTLEKVLHSLQSEEYEIKLSEDLIKKAQQPIIRMLDMSKSLGLIK